MYNTDLPTRAELPTSKQLLRSTFIAIAYINVQSVCLRSFQAMSGCEYEPWVDEGAGANDFVVMVCSEGCDSNHAC